MKNVLNFLLQVTAFADVHNLTIPEAFEQDGGNYMVKAVNKAGEAKCYAKLLIKPPQQPATEVTIRKAVETRRGAPDISHAPPEFVKLFQDKVARPGDAVTLECVITGSPKPKVRSSFYCHVCFILTTCKLYKRNKAHPNS